MDVSMTEHSKSRHFFGAGAGLAECRVPKGFSSRARVISQASESVGHGLNRHGAGLEMSRRQFRPLVIDKI